VTKTYKHSGDLGDIIYSLPVIKALGPGILYLDPKGGENTLIGAKPARGKTKLNSNSINAIKSLLEFQYYIQEVKEWNGENIDFNLDEFRFNINHDNLTQSHLAAFDLPPTLADQPWVIPSSQIEMPKGKTIVVSRSARYQGNHGYWESIAPQIADKAIFLGSEFEHTLWETTFETSIEYIPTPTIVELTNYISACDLFIGNQSLPRAIAESLKKNLICELYRIAPNTTFRRDNAQYV
tara:strand:+ start:197 stop:910 length:714 start_codon:yes stop_codon:yes gene_type:complete